MCNLCNGELSQNIFIYFLYRQRADQNTERFCFLCIKETFSLFGKQNESMAQRKRKTLKCSDDGVEKSKAIPVTGRGGLQSCGMLRILHYLDNRLTDGGEVVSPTHRPLSTPQKHYFSVSVSYLC
jgi:hypothetical protein